jgi:sugar fermentation stimulation protein A
LNVAGPCTILARGEHDSAAERHAMYTGPGHLITFPPGTRIARFLRREKRFLVEVEAEEGAFWVHCNNSGSMMGLLRPGNHVLISPATRPGRKLAYTLELVKANGVWVGVNTLMPNRILRAAWQRGLMPEVSGYEGFHPEVEIGGSRIDALLSGPGRRLWVEAKNVTLVEFDVASFPDAVTQRGQRHLRRLMSLAAEGERSACFYLVQRADARCFSPADFVDPAYVELFWRAVEEGVEIWPYTAVVGPEGISLGPRLSLVRPR